MIGIGIGTHRRRFQDFLPTDLPNLKTWYKPDGLLYNGSNFIHQWTDISGNGNHLLQATETNKPLRVTGLLNGYQGARFDGVDNFLKAVGFTWNQPEMIYIVFNQVSWTMNDKIFDGNAISTGVFFQDAITPEMKIYAGVLSPADANFIIGSFYIATIIFNGANSLLQHNNSTEWTGDASTINMGGFTLGARADGTTQFANIEVMEIIGYYTVAHTADERTTVKNYLSTKYNIAL